MTESECRDRVLDEVVDKLDLLDDKWFSLDVKDIAYTDAIWTAKKVVLGMKGGS